LWDEQDRAPFTCGITESGHGEATTDERWVPFRFPDQGFVY